LAVAKCADSIPIYRLEKDYQRQGIPIARLATPAARRIAALVLLAVLEHVAEKASIEVTKVA